MTEWIEEQNLRAELGGVVGVIRAVATGLLVAGAKSFTHMITFVERYGAVLDGLLREAGTQVASRLCCEAASQAQLVLFGRGMSEGGLRISLNPSLAECCLHPGCQVCAIAAASVHDPRSKQLVQVRSQLRRHRHSSPDRLT